MSNQDFKKGVVGQVLTTAFLVQRKDPVELYMCFQSSTSLGVKEGDEVLFRISDGNATEVHLPNPEDV